MRGDRRHGRSRGHQLVRACVLACIAFALSAQLAGADSVGPAIGSDESVAITDGVTVTPPAASASDERVAVSDVVGVVLPAAASGDSTVAVTDQVGVFPQASIGSAEPVVVTDSVSVAPSPFLSDSEPVSVSDSVVVLTSPVAGVAESVGVSDAVSVATSPVIGVEEHALVVDAVTVEALLPPTRTSLVPGAEPLLRGRAETLVATVTAGGSPVTSGEVTLRDGGAVIAGPTRVDATGRASFVVDGLALGSHSLSASFDGAPIFLSSDGAATVDVYDYALSLSPPAQNVQRGAVATYSLTAALVPGSSTGGSTATLPLSVSGTPTGATASFSGPLALPSLGTTTLQVATTPTTAVGDATLVVEGDGSARTATAHLYVNAALEASAGGPYTVAEGSTITLAGSATGADPATLVAAWDLDGDGTFETAGLTPSFLGLDGPAIVPVRLRVCDDHGACATANAIVTVTNVAPTAHITAPAGGTIVPTGTPVGFAGSFTDPGTLDTQTATWSFGATGLSTRQVFTAAGFPTVTLTVTDKDGGVGTASIGLVVVNTHASTIGAGWFRTGAGRTSFVFVAGYAGSTPRGRVELETPRGEFDSTSYRYLVVSGSTFELDGVGTFNGTRGVPFHLSGVDGRPDRLRVRIGSVYDSGGPVPLGRGAILVRP